MKVGFKKKFAEIDKGSMKRVLGVSDLFAIGYGDLGSSIYYALGITALFALGAAPISLTLAGLVFACTALTYAELSSILKIGGGSVSFTKHAFNDLISFIAGWGLLLDFIVTIAISSYSIGPYLSFFFSALKDPDYKIGLTVCIIAILFFVNFRGAKGSGRLCWILTSLTLVTQLLIIVIGCIYLLDIPDLFDHMRINVKGSLWSPTWAEFWKGTAMAMVAYTGIESMSQLSSEAKHPQRTVPKAIIYAMTLLLIVFIGTTLIALSALTPSELSTTYLENPIVGIVKALPFGGQWLGGWVGLLGGVILFVAANAGLMGASRLAFRMGENYQIPRFIYQLHSKHKTPFISLAIFALLAIFIVILSGGKLTFLADLYNFGAMLAFFMAHLSLIILRIKKPELKREFRAPLNIHFEKFSIPITAIIGGLATLATWFLVVFTKPDGRYLGFSWLLVGLLMYVLYRRKKEIPTTGNIEIEKIKIPEFKTIHYKNILVPIREGFESGILQMACEIAKHHHAKVTAIHVLEVPFSIPLDSPLPHRTIIAETILKRTEAIGREFNMQIMLRIIHSRSVENAILTLLKNEDFDLLILGTSIKKEGILTKQGITVEKLLKEVDCPVLIYARP